MNPLATQMFSDALFFRSLHPLYFRFILGLMYSPFVCYFLALAGGVVVVLALPAAGKRLGNSEAGARVCGVRDR